MTEKQQEQVKFKLNGKEVSVPKGWTVMQATKREGVEIPHFCWHPGLSIAGVCRFCMVKVEGRPKLEIACNLQATEGMVVNTELPEVKEAHKWALEFHLINHPLDCPICDQAGECGLQNYYMEVGKYPSQMTRPKVLKPKALDVGGDLVLDTERCILCSRCVRFEDEITKTQALGIFDRGDRSIIGIYPGKKINHNYTANLVDICPVGAFTSKDFRFKQRVWFLQDKPSICPGCSTGCAINVYCKEQVRKFFRIKPRHDDSVNGHWMCDKGRHAYEHLNKEHRLLFAYDRDEKGKRKTVSVDELVATLAIKLAQTSPNEIALLVSAQYTNEEYKALFAFFIKSLGIRNIYQWREPTENIAAFDGILYRGDHNANTQGLLQELKEHGIQQPIQNGFDALISNHYIKTVVALAPELSSTFPSLNDQLKQLEAKSFVSLWTLNINAMNYNFPQLLPMKGFAEKTGVFLNFDKRARSLTTSFPSVVNDAKDVCAATKQLEDVWQRTHRRAEAANA